MSWKKGVTTVYIFSSHLFKYRTIICRIKLVRENNARLSDEVGNLLQVRAEKERRAMEIAEPPVREIKRDNRHIPGLKSLLPVN